MSRDAVERLVAKHLATARKTWPSLNGRRITLHSLRHSAAMDLLRCGVDRSVIALWLGHESMETTQIYLYGDMRLKEQALARTTDSRLVAPRYRPRGRPDGLPRGPLMMPPAVGPPRLGGDSGVGIIRRSA